MAYGSVFDFHVRLAPGQQPLDRLYTAMDGNGITRAAVAAGGVLPPAVLSRQLVDSTYSDVDPDNDAVLAACQSSRGRLVPVYFANPHRSVEVYRKRQHEFRGLELSPAVHGFPLTDWTTAEFVTAAGEAGHSVYVVCLIRAGCGVADLAALAARFPTVRFVLGHGGASSIDFHAVTLIEPHHNIYFESSGTYSSVLAFALLRLGARRVLFGSEHPLQHPSVELAKLAVLRLNPGDLEQIRWRNAHRLLGEEIEDE